MKIALSTLALLSLVRLDYKCVGIESHRVKQKIDRPLLKASGFHPSMMNRNCSIRHTYLIFTRTTTNKKTTIYKALDKFITLKHKQ